MSVLIKGMKMPKGCVYCTFCDGKFGLSGEVKCYAKTKHGRKLPRAYNIHDWRPEWCPLIEIPDKHGRLIDADDVKRRMIPLSFSVQNWISEVELSNCRTVIKAEKVDE